MHQRTPYTGTHRRLVVGIDVGTTFSGVSYAILDPGVVPEIRGVNRFPAQGAVGADCKIPSVIYYDADGVPRAFGAETRQQDIIEQAEDENWTKAAWFKLHLQPRSMKSSSHSRPPLPRQKTAQDVFADFIAYLYRCAATYIQETHGDLLWLSIEKHIDFVLSHPNGWEGHQQKILRRAAVTAGLFTDDRDGHARLEFVTEGEASLNFCISQGLTTAAMQNGQGVIIVDAGGGTVDISAYHIALKTWIFQEIASAQCLLQGSTFVIQRAASFLENTFKDFPFVGDVPPMVEIFDTATKLTFRSSTVPAYIKFGCVRNNDRNRDVRNGRLTISGPRVEEFFKPSFDAIMDAIIAQKEEAKRKKPVAVLYLVGGFAASE